MSERTPSQRQRLADEERGRCARIREEAEASKHLWAVDPPRGDRGSGRAAGLLSPGGSVRKGGPTRPPRIERDPVGDTWPQSGACGPFQGWPLAALIAFAISLVVVVALHASGFERYSACTLYAAAAVLGVVFSIDIARTFRDLGGL